MLHFAIDVSAMSDDPIRRTIIDEELFPSLEEPLPKKSDYFDHY